ncbi:hypothetical protein SAMN02949497_1758 [Methylomagnum ishizawai]|uniref:Uncharacterized protein n=1 Tax=Methylomagnum ishizawai TaxID=1760988 RepID=A0A1Y6D0S6_9GAMM|nr:hypothetical protein [Methylomagnum ishizawai]SMF94443.1 hypothetical protein SAMN02949497_1758 [Methylomagnum ishizawai]
MAVLPFHSHPVRRLATVSERLETLRGTDHQLFKVAEFDEQLDALRDILAGLQTLDEIYEELGRADGAMDMLLRLLLASSSEPLDGGSLQCLMEPIHTKISRAHQRLIDEII